MNRKERYQKIIEWFLTNMPVAETELHHRNPYELLVAVILSAQCTDKRVNMETLRLFEAFPTPESMAASSPEVIFEYIKSITFPNNKSKSLHGMAVKLVTEYGSEVPADVEELQKLPGVGRKTANVIASVIYNQPTMAVDTHVFRVSERIGLVTNSKNPLQTELTLIKYIPKELIPRAHHWLILHGRYVCTARSPKCDSCGIAPYCRFYSKKIKL